MVGGILLLAIAVFGILIMFGKAKPETFYKFVIFLIFAPLFLAVGVNHVLWLWYGLPLGAQVLSILLLPFLLSVSLRMLFPKAKWLQSLQTVVFQTLIYFVTFPFRFLWRAGQFFFRRERQIQQLNPYRPVVGAKPPVQNERRKESPREKILD
jgi:hypothetical protein